jgi:hypothetical protein
MSSIARLFRCALLLLVALGAVTAHAQATRTWVSGVGDDANPCSRTAPCKTFPGAISKTAAGGVIDVLDPGGFGGVTITKSITLENVGAVGSVLVSGTNAIVVNDGGAGTAVVVLRGLSLEGLATGVNGVLFASGKQLLVERCDIGNFSGGAGIAFTPTKTASLSVIDTTIHNNGASANPSTTGGILIAPGGSATVDAVLQNVRIVDNNGFGLQAKGAATATVRNSVASQNAGDGLVASSTTIAAKLLLDAVLTSGNGGSGILAQGAAALVQLSDSTISGNVQGIRATGGGAVISFGNNRNFNNNTNGAPTATNPLQ